MNELRCLTEAEINIVAGGFTPVEKAAVAYGVGIGVGTAGGAMLAEVVSGSAAIGVGAGSGAAMGAVVVSGFFLGFYGANALGADAWGTALGEKIYEMTVRSKHTFGR